MMKYNLFLLAALAVTLGFSSCTKDSISNESEKNKKIEMTIGVSSSIDPQTRAYIPSNDETIGTGSSDIWWESTDCIKLYSQNDVNGTSFSFDSYVSVDTKQNAYFKGYVTECDKGYYVIYPASAGCGFNVNDNTITAVIPDVQTATAHSFDPAAMVQTGYTSGSDKNVMTLDNTCAFLYINLCEGCTKVVVEDNNNHAYGLAGKVKIASNSSGSKIDGTNGFIEKKYTVTLNNPTGAAGQYLICVIPADNYPGLKVTVWKGSKYKIKAVGSSTEKVSLDAGKIYSLGKIADKDWLE